MRPADRQIQDGHDDLLGVTSEQHHPIPQTIKVQINSASISGLSSYEHRVSIGPGHKTFLANLRGNEVIQITGHAGALVLASDSSGQCSGISAKPYGAGGYYTSYMGGYSRLHGDSYLTPDLFGSSVRLRDAYIDTATDEAVLEFYNVNAASRSVVCYGTIMVK